MSESVSIAVDERVPRLVLTGDQVMPAGEHGAEHRVRVAGEGLTGRRVDDAADIESDDVIVVIVHRFVHVCRLVTEQQDCTQSVHKTRI